MQHNVSEECNLQVAVFCLTVITVLEYAVELMNVALLSVLQLGKSLPYPFSVK
jgi:hypothetical protein